MNTWEVRAEKEQIDLGGWGAGWGTTGGDEILVKAGAFNTKQCLDCDELAVMMAPLCVALRDIRSLLLYQVAALLGRGSNSQDSPDTAICVSALESLFVFLSSRVDSKQARRHPGGTQEAPRRHLRGCLGHLLKQTSARCR